MLTKQDFNQIKKIVETAVDPIKKDLKKVDKKVDLVIKSFDREYLGLQKRIMRVETHLQLKPLADF